MSDELKTEVEREIAANKILVYGKGTKSAPRCGFTLETIEFFNHFGYPSKSSTCWRTCPNVKCSHR